MKIMKILSVVFLMMVSGVEGWAQEKDWVGTWQYSAPQADYQYSKGNIIFKMEGKELTAVIEVNESKIQTEQLKVSEDQVSFNIVIEGQPIKISLQMKDDTISGEATYSEGVIPITGTKSA